jgi:hypothetical protein
MNFEIFKKNKIKTLFLFPMVLTMMGNEKSCEQQPVSQKRQLKRIVEIQKIVSPSVNFGPAGTFDFEFVANQQLIGVLQNSGDFAFRLMPPVQSNPTPARFALNGPGDFPESKILNLVGSDKTLMKSWLAGPSEKPAVLATQSTEAWCMVNKPQAVISGSVNSFELLGGGGLSLGFSPAGAHAVSVDMLKVGFEFFQLDLSLNATSPAPLYMNLASSNVTSKQTKTRLGAGLNLGGITVGPSVYFQTPLAKVTKAALTKAVNDLRAKFKSDDWFTRVLANKDADLMIVGGANVNLKVGDELAIYNELYTWSGEPCDSTLEYDGIAKYPVAKGFVNTVGRDVSFLTLTYEEEERVQIGATVRLVRLVEDIPVAKSASSTPAK